MFDWLSSFMLNPAFAAGTAAVASPILIHILSKRRFRRIRWAAMDFLLQAQRQNRRRVRLERLILLLLRCLAVFLIAIVMTRPFVRPDTLAAILGSAAKTERIFLLDGSFSMGGRPAAGSAVGDTVFAQATRAVGDIVRLIAEESPQDTVTIFSTDQPREPAFTLASLSEADLSRLQGDLATRSPSQTTARFPDAIAAIANLLRDRPTQANAVVYIVSDFQRTDWLPDDLRAPQSVPAPLDEGRPAPAPGRAPAPGGSRSAAADQDGPPSLIEPLARLVREGRSIGLVLVDVSGRAARPNLTVTDVAADQPQVVAGVPGRFRVTIANHTPKPLHQVELNISTVRHTLPPIVIPSLQPGQIASEPVEVTFPEQGSDLLKAQLSGISGEDDTLALDNARFLAVNIVPAVKVLVVSGEPGDDPALDEAYLLKTALRPAGRVDSGNELTVVPEDGLDALDARSLTGPDAYDVIILANVARLGPGAKRNLGQFVRAGGGLVIFAGDQIDVDFYNGQLYDGGRGFLPAPFREVVSTAPAAPPFTIADWDAAHPIMRAFDGQLASVLRQVHVFSFAAVDVSTTQPSRAERAPGLGRGVAQPADPAPLAQQRLPARDRESPLGPNRPPPKIIARYSDPEHSPAMLLRPYGRGTCLLITTTADQEWNDWPANFSYVPMMLELVQHTARHGGLAGRVIVGAPLTCTVAPGAFESTAKVMTPGFPLEPEFAVKAEATPTDEAVFRLANTAKAGVYRFELTATTGEPGTRYAVVNPDAAESNLAGVNEAELDRALAGMPFEYIRDPSTFATQAGTSNRELWWPLLVAAIMVLMLEHGLAWWFGTRR